MDITRHENAGQIIDTGLPQDPSRYEAARALNAFYDNLGDAKVGFGEIEVSETDYNLGETLRVLEKYGVNVRGERDLEDYVEDHLNDDFDSRQEVKDARECVWDARRQLKSTPSLAEFLEDQGLSKKDAVYRNSTGGIELLIGDGWVAYESDLTGEEKGKTDLPVRDPPVYYEVEAEHTDELLDWMIRNGAAQYNRVPQDLLAGRKRIETVEWKNYSVGDGQTLDHKATFERGLSSNVPGGVVAGRQAAIESGNTGFEELLGEDGAEPPVTIDMLIPNEDL